MSHSHQLSCADDGISRDYDGLWCLVDGNVFARGGFGLAPHRLGVVDVPAKLMKVEDVKVIGHLDQVNKVLSQIRAEP